MMLWTVINAVSGETLLTEAVDDVFDQWNDHHADYRKVRGLEEVNPTVRERYKRRGSREVFVVQD